jgi:hypothetical protein
MVFNASCPGMTLFLVAALALAQEPAQHEPMHLFAIPLNGARTTKLTALSIERGAGYPSTINLKGAVEIKTPACFPTGKHGKMTCDGYMILRADEATYHEDSGEIEARGIVTVTPLHHENGTK